jgi:hypothetical protein
MCVTVENAMVSFAILSAQEVNIDIKSYTQVRYFIITED